MTQNEHVYAICCRPEVAGDVISGENAKTVEGYAVLNFEVASLCSFRDIQNKIPTKPKAVGSGIVDRFSNFDNCQSEEAGDVISGVAVNPAGVKARVKFGDSRSNHSQDIRLLRFVTNDNKNDDDDAGRRTLR